jgi:hypothetical protein
LLVTHLAKLNYAPRALNCTKAAVGATAIIFEIASRENNLAGESGRQESEGE